MEIYIDIHFPLEIKRYGTKGGTISSKQYLPYILSISPLNLNIGDDHGFEVSNVDILFDDLDNHFRDIFADDINKNIQNSLVIFYKNDGTKVATLKIWDYSLLPDKKFQITCTNKIGELYNDFTEKITLEEFPAAPTLSVGEVIPDCYGEMIITGGTDGSVKAWQVEADKYLINGTVVAGSSLSGAFLEDGTDISGSSSLSTTADGLRQTVTYSATNPNFIICDFTIGTYKSNNVQDVLEANANKWVEFNSGNYTSVAALDTYLDGAQYNNNFRYYANVSAKTGEEVLKDFCDSYNVDWIANSDNEIEIKWIDIMDLDAKYTIQDNKAKEMPFELSVDPEEYGNKIIMQGHYHYYDGTFQKKFYYNEFESQSLFGVKPVNIDAKFLKSDEMIVWSAKYYAMFNKNPRIRVLTQISADDYFDNSLEPGDLVDFKHPDSQTPTTVRLYQIRKVSISFDTDMIGLELWDVNYLKDIDKNIKLLIQSNYGDDYTDHFDLSMRLDGSGNHVLNPALSISHQDTQKLFQASSVYAWGYRRITTPNDSDWDIFNNTNADATISIYFFVHDMSGTYTNAQQIIEHYEDGSNFWFLRMKSSGSGTTGIVQMLLYDSGVNRLDLENTTAVTVNTWTNITFCKVGADCGIYFNGVQEGYASLGAAYNLAGLLYLFGTSPRSRYLQAYVSELFLSDNNFYGAAPVVGVTDDISANLRWHPLGQNADQKTLTIYTPRSGDSLTIGNTYRIRWNIPGLNVTIELWDSSGSGGAKVSDIDTVVNKQYYDWDTTGLSAADRTVKVYATDDISGNINDWSDVFTLV